MNHVTRFIVSAFTATAARSRRIGHRLEGPLYLPVQPFPEPLVVV